MSELSEVINEMRNMRESYDQLGAAAEAYNTGKTQLAQNITDKGVQASPTETLPELAEKVAAIAQESYTIDGGEMYAKQLFGSLDTPNYWNLYEVLANLLSDGRLVSYGGILLAEYYRGYDSLALSGAGAGGAYVVSDLDENGQFKMYTADTTHTWATEFDGHGNRWVAYCFADEYHDFQITDTNTSPRSIFIGRKIGSIRLLANSRTSQIVVPDGNELKKYLSNSKSSNFDRLSIIRNIDTLATGMIYSAPNMETLYIECKHCETSVLNNTALQNITIVCENGIAPNNDILFASSSGLKNLIIKAPYIHGRITYQTASNPYLCFITEELYQTGMGIVNNNSIKYVYLGYITNDKTKSVNITNPNADYSAATIVLQDGWNKPVNISQATGMNELTLRANILQSLKQDEEDCGDGVTITLGATNLAKLTSEESQALLAELRGTYGYTFA